MIAKIQLKLNNDVLLTVIKMIKHTDDYIVENLTDALLISIKEDLINKLEDKAKTIQKQVSILDHNKKHSLVLKYHEAYSLYKLLDAVYEKQLFSDNLHIKKIKRLITELNNKLDIFAKEEDITIIDEDPLEETTTENLPGKILVLEETEEDTNKKVEQIEMPILFDFSEAFAGEQDEVGSLEEIAPSLEENTVLKTEFTTEIEFTPEAIQEATPEVPIASEADDNMLEVTSEITEEVTLEAITAQESEVTAIIETLEEVTPVVELSTQENFPTQETIYDTESDLFMSAIPETQPKLDWERITTEDQVEDDNSVNTKEKVAFSNPMYNELFNIAKTGINVDVEDLVVKPNKEEEPITNSITEEPVPSKDVMQIEIFDLETIESEQTEVKPKKEKKKEKKASVIESIGQISLF
jgi:hypothetical protein